jgi:uncharacterized membrane protein
MGLAILSVGLRRGSRSLRLGGFAVLGLSLAKIFLYDLSNLSSVTRALSFLAVGTVLLIASFVYQRITRRDEEDATRSRAGLPLEASEMTSWLSGGDDG